MSEPVAGNAALEELQYRLLEPPDLGVTWGSGFWTRTEVLWALNHRQQRYLQDTGIVVGVALVGAAQQVEQALPADWVQTVAMAFVPDATGRYRPLVRVDSLQADYGVASWPTTLDTPIGYADHETDTLTTRVIPGPNVPGQFDLVYIADAPDVDGTGAVDDAGLASDIFIVPAEFVPYVLYGALADLFGKIGRGQDLPKAAYCEARYNEGVAIGRLLLFGGD